MRKATTIAALLALGAFGCNRPPAPQTASHPPVLDLTCQIEPAGLTDEQVLSDTVSEAAGLGRPYEQAFNDGVLLAGRDCRDTLKRNCGWHQARGAQIDCDRRR